jgi:tetratricopeptide (TPR) repeat protein
VPKAIQLALAAVAVAAMLYGGLLGVSTLTTSPVQELSAVAESETAIEGYQSSPAPIDDVDAATPDELFLRALSLIREARTTTFGLFPRYDQADLSRAEALLDEVLGRDETGDFLRREAFFFRAKTRLALGEIEAARSDFKTVAQLDSRRAKEAVSILKQLQDAYPARPGDVPQ